MTVAMSKALGEGARIAICASTGNTAASAAAYAGRAGMRAFVLIPRGAVALGKLSQSVMHGAGVIEVIGNFDICLKVVRDVAESDPVESGWSTASTRTVSPARRPRPSRFAIS